MSARQTKTFLGFRKLDPRARAPFRATEFAAGYDLAILDDTTILPHSNIIMATGLQIFLPTNCYGRIAPRSGLSINTCLAISGGVIDHDYT